MDDLVGKSLVDKWRDEEALTYKPAPWKPTKGDALMAVYDSFSKLAELAFLDRGLDARQVWQEYDKLKKELEAIDSESI